MTSHVVFIAGSTRSGTTVLRLILDHHSEICVPGELEWALDFNPPSGAASMRAYRDALEVNRGFHHSKVVVDENLELDDLIRSFLAQMKHRSGPEKLIVGAQIHDHYAGFLRLWPEARFLHIVRDGRDVCASWLLRGWVGTGYRGGQRWSKVIEQWQCVKNQIPAERVLEIRFEDLVEDAPTNVSRICAFLGVEYEPGMLEYWRDTTYGPVSAREARKWRETLKPRQVQLFETTAAAWLVHYGYPLSGLPKHLVGPVEQRLLEIEDQIQRARVDVKQFGFRLWVGEQLTRRLGPRILHRYCLSRQDNVIESGLK